jgi:ribonuclease III
MVLADTRRNKDLKRLLEKLGLSDLSSVNWKLLDFALTHVSISTENNYEQLEFVGDSVLRLVASETLFETYPDAPVGEFAAIRSMLVSDRTLAEFAHSYGFERYLMISTKAPYDSEGKISLLADAFEAVLGALYLSTKTMKLINPWLKPLLKEKAAEIKLDPALQNYKDALQDWTQKTYKKLPEYKVKENLEEREHEKRFQAEVWFQGKCLAKGIGRSKKAAQQAAAKEAFLAIKNKEKYS